MDEKLDQIVKEKVVELVQYADWTAPIIPVLNSDQKTVQICSDFELTVNRAAKLDRYPTSNIKDHFTTLACGELFTQLGIVTLTSNSSFLRIQSNIYL